MPFTHRNLLAPSADDVAIQRQRPSQSHQRLRHRPSFAERLVGQVFKHSNLSFPAKNENQNDVQVLEAEGLARYADPDVIRVAELEIAEAYNLTPEQLDMAAQHLMQGGSAPPGSTHPRYFDHMGGVSPNEVRDYNQYSQQGLLKPAENYPSDYAMSDHLNTNTVPSVRHADDLMFVTTL